MHTHERTNDVQINLYLLTHWSAEQEEWGEFAMSNVDSRQSAAATNAAKHARLQQRVMIEEQILFDICAQA